MAKPEVRGEHGCGSANRSTTCTKRDGPFGRTHAHRLNPGTTATNARERLGAASEAEQLWSTRTAEDLVGNTEFETEQRLDAELGYGMSGPSKWGTLTPYGGFTLADGAERTLRTGLRWKASNSATVALEAERQNQAADAPPTNALMLRAHVRF